jgi:hypothetical protein
MDDTVPLPDADGQGGEHGGADDIDALLADFGEGHAETADGGAMAGDDFMSGIMDALKHTEPHTPLQDVESPIDMEHGGIPRIFRGIQKLAGFDAAMAGVDIVLGLVELFLGAGARADADPRMGQSRAEGQTPNPLEAGEGEVVDEWDPSDL